MRMINGLLRRPRLATRRTTPMRTGSIIATGTSDDEELLQRIFDVFQIVGLDDDIYSTWSTRQHRPASQADLTNQFLNARAEFRDRLTDPDIAALVEGFDPGKYNENATLGENLPVRHPVGDAFDGG